MLGCGHGLMFDFCAQTADPNIITVCVLLQIELLLINIGLCYVLLFVCAQACWGSRLAWKVSYWYSEPTPEEKIRMAAVRDKVITAEVMESL